MQILTAGTMAWQQIVVESLHRSQKQVCWSKRGRMPGGHATQGRTTNNQQQHVTTTVKRYQEDFDSTAAAPRLHPVSVPFADSFANGCATSANCFTPLARQDVSLFDFFGPVMIKRVR